MLGQAGRTSGGPFSARGVPASRPGLWRRSRTISHGGNVAVDDDILTELLGSRDQRVWVCGEYDWGVAVWDLYLAIRDVIRGES